MKDFSNFIKECRRIREESLSCGAYPIAEEEALILYAITFEKAVLMKGVNVVEVGSGCGYSGIWFLKALGDSGYPHTSRVVMIEKEKKRAEKIVEVIERIGYPGPVEIKIGDAKDVLKAINFPVHIAFLDAAKSEYHVYLKLLEPNLLEGSIVLAHNFEEYWGMTEYVKIVMDKSKYITSVLPTSLSLAISIKI